jgi:membrane protease YdiL (CAAX protease family)
MIRVNEKYFVLFGVMATLIVGIAQDFFSRIAKSIIFFECANLLIVVIVISILLIFFPERFRISKVTLLMAISGIVLACLYYCIFGKAPELSNSSKPIELSVFIIYIIDIGLVTPFFEELVVRRLLFFGLANWINKLFKSAKYLISAILVSIVFGFVHKNIILIAFVFSIIMCAASLKGIKTLDRAVLHGCYNIFVVMAPVISPHF